MDVEKIKALLLAVEKKSFSKAAEELSYTPSAFSHIVDSIESELGVKILNRNFSGVDLNENGEILLEKLTALVNAEKELLICAKDLNEKNEHLRIGTYSSIAQHLLPEIIKAFKEENPQVKVSIKTGNNLRKWLKDDVADVIFTDVKVSNANWIDIITDPYMIFAPTSLLPHKKTATVDDIYALPYILYNESNLNDYIDLNKFKEIIKYDSIDESSVISMVENGIGVAVLPSLMLKNKHKGAHTVKLMPEITRTLGVAYKKEESFNTAKTKFIKCIKKLYQ